MSAHPVRKMSLLASASAAVLLSACAANAPQRPSASRPAPSAQPAAPPQSAFSLTTVTFADLPEWKSIDTWPAMVAFKRHCNVILQRAPNTPLTGEYGGVAGDWQPACRQAVSIQPGQSQWFFENFFYPARVAGPGESRLTAYFEPVVQATRDFQPPFTEPFLSKPIDMVTVDLGAFADARQDDVLHGAPRRLTGRIKGDVVEPYPKRGDIIPYDGQIIAYAHPADVYNLQVQGSGRLQFPNGSQVRAAFAAQNGYSWNSALGALYNLGEITAGSWNAFRQWFDANPGRKKDALDTDPSYVFFNEETITDPNEGPKGAAGIPLTALGSIAVDPAYHPYGAVVFIDGQYDGAPFRKLLVAQDTGGAIRRGPQRGDVFFGSGDQAGAQAEKMNAPANWWTLLPRPTITEGPVAELAPAAPAQFAQNRSGVD